MTELFETVAQQELAREHQTLINTTLNSAQ